ncbi:MBL fold metallo-hydrolase [Acidithiobacillus sp.]
MIFRQLCTPGSGLLTYLLGDSVTREAVVLDPLPAQVETLLTFMAERGLVLRYILETHMYEGHPEAALALKQHSEARIVAHECAKSEHVDMCLRDGDLLYFGEETLRVIHTPGHTPCAVTYWWEDRLFTGETLLATGAGLCRPRAGGDPQKLYHSIASRLLTFPGETLVYPGRESKGRRLVSIEELRRHNNWFNNRRGGQVFLRAYQRLLPDKTIKEESNNTGVQEDDVHHYMPGRDVSASS